MAVIKACVLDVAALGAAKRQDVWSTCVYLRTRYEGQKTHDEIIGLVKEFSTWLAEEEWEDKTPSPRMVREWWERFAIQCGGNQPQSSRELEDYEKEILVELQQRRAAEKRDEGVVN